MKNIEKIAQNPEKLAKFIADVDRVFSMTCLKTDWLESEDAPDEIESYTIYLAYLDEFVRRRREEFAKRGYSRVKCSPLSYDRLKELIYR